MLDAPQIVQAAAQPAAIVRLTVPRDQIQLVMGPGLQEIRAALAAQAIIAAGPWYTHHLRMDPAIFDFEIGVPVPAPVAPSGRVEPGALRAATVARAVYHGPFEGLGPAWGELLNWLTAHGHTAAADLWEVYLAGPETSPDPAAWQTQLNWPLDPES
jgi:effector-binding domain-containing protein